MDRLAQDAVHVTTDEHRIIAADEDFGITASSGLGITLVYASRISPFPNDVEAL